MEHGSNRPEKEVSMSAPTLSPPDAGGVRDYQMFYGGRWVDAESGERFDSLDPYRGEVWATAPLAGPKDVQAAVKSASEALDGPWGRTSATERGHYLRRLAGLIADHAEALAVTETTDNGKLLREMTGQMAILPDWFYYFAGAADKLEGRTIPVARTNFLVYTRLEPIGVVGAVLPWNSPLLLLSGKLAPALAAGCTFVAKPAEQTPASTLEFARLVEEAGFPPGVFNVVTGAGETGRSLISDPGVNKVAFTGSTETGIAVMKGAADHLAKVTLELGGKSPNIVFEDADLDAATNGVIAGIFAATGQTCTAGSRLLVQRSIYDDLLSRVTERARTIKLGNPLEPETEMGPVAFRDQLERIMSYIEIGLAEGARLVCGGERPTGSDMDHGYFLEPTIFVDVDNRMRIAQEEIFGPVLAVIPFVDEDDAIAIGNDTKYGLCAGVWTRDGQRAHRVAHRLKAGTVWVNSYRLISYNVPYGGFKESGIGRENGFEGLAEYTQTKSVWLELSGETRDPFTLG
jgi:(Z)-2-((N-methylformamido)methylene)-5-hydroxybutyrolactone dehydrogenase